MSTYDIEHPDWVATNDDGLWCGFCGYLMVSAFHADEDTVCPESCRQCGAPDAEEMQEYFA
jgi:hypothetical protein